MPVVPVVPVVPLLSSVTLAARVTGGIATSANDAAMPIIASCRFDSVDFPRNIDAPPVPAPWI
jgi:hypothetical protein